jgi:hypothetical protein
MTQQTTFALAIPSVSDSARLSQLSADSVPVGSMAGNFNSQSPEFAALLFAVDEPATEDKADYMTKPFPVKWWAAKKTELVAERSGEVTAAVRVVLVSADLKTLAFTSAGIVDSLDLIRAVKGEGPYDPAVGVTVHPVSTRSGRQMLRLRLAPQ